LASSKKTDDFICVQGTQKYANQFKVKGVPLALFTDADGDEIHRAVFFDDKSLSRAMESATQKYSDQPVPWKTEFTAEAGSKKILVVGFDDEKEEGLKALEDKSLVKFRDRLVFLKQPYEKNGAAVNKWKVIQAPSLVLADASKESPEKDPLERLSGKKTPMALKMAIQKALRKLDSGK
jgi:hypothetical protein